MVTWLAAPISEQAAVTDLPTRVGLTIATALVIAGLLYGLRVGWRHRAQRQTWAKQPPTLELSSDDAQQAGGVQGKYMGTVTAGNWTDRVVAGGGMSRCWATVDDTGLLLRRQGQAPLFIEVAQLRAVGTAPGILQKVFGRHGVLMVTWLWNDQMVTSGIWYPDVNDQHVVRDLISGLLTSKESLT